MLSSPALLFEQLQKIDKAYRRYYHRQLSQYGFSPNEVLVLLFLHNNAPVCDTASDIVRCKGISKGMVARSIDSLCQKGYLETRRDPKDRRIIHLSLSEKCSPIRAIIEEKQCLLSQLAQQEITEQDMEITFHTLERLLSNTEALLKEEYSHAANEFVKKC